MFRKNEKRIEDFEYYPTYLYTLPHQTDGFNCGICVGVYMVMIARNLIEYSWPEDMQQFRYRLALAIEHNDVEYFLKMTEL